MSMKMAEEFLRKIEIGDVSDVTPIEMGEISRVFSYRRNQSEFVIHFKRDQESFNKGKFIYDHYSQYGVPVPRVVTIGHSDDLYYSITEKVPGIPISALNEKQIYNVLPDLIKQFTKMNQIEIDRTKGYGWVSPSIKKASCDT